MGSATITLNVTDERGKNRSTRENQPMPRSAIPNVLSLAVFGLVAGIAAATVSAQGLVTTHRISAAMASELVTGAVATCKQQTYNVTAVVLDIDGVPQAMLRADGAGIATLEVAKAAVAGRGRHQDRRRDGRRPRS
jgi:Haem-degrading